jgi:hypothetical protein
MKGNLSLMTADMEGFAAISRLCGNDAGIAEGYETYCLPHTPMRMLTRGSTWQSAGPKTPVTCLSAQAIHRSEPSVEDTCPRND